MAAADRDRGHRLLRHPARARGPGPRPARRHDSKDPVLMSEQSFMERFGPRLVANGYPILPIMPGTKKPGRFRNGAWSDYPDWTRHAERARPPSTSSRSGRTWPDAGVGIVCGSGRRGRHRHHGSRAGARARAARPRAARATRRRSGSAARRSGCWSIAPPRRSPASAARRSRCWASASSSSRMPSTPTPAGPTSGRRRASPISTSAICRRSTRRRCARSSTRRWRWCRIT